MSIPTSVSVFRTSPDRAIGETGEVGGRYIAADAALQSAPGLLDAIRPWMTLDATPADRARAGGYLEGWSCFPCGSQYFVVRLATAGNGDRRDSWFAHGRAWPLEAMASGFDPGLYLGQGAAFQTGVPTAGTESDLPPPTIEPMDPVLAEPGLAIGLLAHLLNGMASGYPLILAVPTTAFAVGAPLARVVAFARGALPSRLARRCRIRVYTGNPALFLGPSQSPGTVEPGPADLLVVPEGLSVPALTAAGRRALLLDARGTRHHGPEPADALVDYARAVLDNAQRFPAQLTAFAERFDRQLSVLDPGVGPLPGAEQTRWAALTYRLAVALAGTESQRGSLFANALLDRARAAPDLPWADLIRPEEWARFPQDHLIRLILRPDDDLEEGERRLRDALVQAFQRLGATVDAGLAAWWSPSDSGKRQRLLELCELEPPLVSPEGSAAPLAEILSGHWTAPGADALLRCDGALRIRPAPGLAALLLGHESIARRLLLQDLLALGAVLPADAQAAVDVYHRRIDALMREAPESTTAGLIGQGAWLAWRRRADRGFDRETLRRLALEWMTSPALADLRDPQSRQRPPQWRTTRPQERRGGPTDITLETWRQVLDDLEPLSLDELRRLLEPATGWPWIHPFQQDQIQDLAARCGSPQARAELAEAMRDSGDGIAAHWTGPVIAALAAASGHAEALDELRARVRDAAGDDGRRAELHPLSELAEAIRALPTHRRRASGPLMLQGWIRLRDALADESACYAWATAGDGRPRLPLVRVAAALRSQPRLGELGRWLMTRPDAAAWRADPRWWEALIGSMVEESAPSGSAAGTGPRWPWERPEATARAALQSILAEQPFLPKLQAQALGLAWETHGPGSDTDRPLSEIEQ